MRVRRRSIADLKRAITGDSPDLHRLVAELTRRIRDGAHFEVFDYLRQEGLLTDASRADEAIYMKFIRGGP